MQLIGEVQIMGLEFEPTDQTFGSICETVPNNWFSIWWAPFHLPLLWTKPPSMFMFSSFSFFLRFFICVS